MSKYNTILIIAFLFINISLSYSQESSIDSIISLNISDIEKTQKLRGFTLKNIDESSIKDFKDATIKLIYFADKTNSKKTKAQALLMLAEKFKRNRELDSAITYISKSIKQFQDLKHDSLLIKAYNSKAGILNHFQKYDSAVVHYKRAIKLGEKTKNLQLLGYAYEGYSTVLSNQGLEVIAIKNSQKSLEISKENNFKKLEIISLTGLGWKLLKTGNNEQSINYLQQAYQKYDPEIIEDKEVLCDILRFLALNYRRSGKSDLVSKYGKMGVECFESTGNIMLASDVMNTIGANLLAQERYTEALSLFEELIEKSKSINSQLGANFYKINLSSALINLNKFDRGKNTLLEVLKDTLRPEYLPKRIEKVVYQNLAEVYELKGDYKRGLNYHRKFKHLEDSLNKASNLKEITDIDINYQTEKKEKENLQLKADKVKQAELLAQESKRKWQLGAGLLTTLLTLVIFTFYYRRNKKQKEVIESLQKELHHRIKNNLSIIDTFIEVAKEEFDDQKFSLKLTELQNRIDSINEVHQQLYKNKDVTNLNLKNYIDTLSSNVSNSFSNNKVEIEKEVDDNLNLNADKSFPVGLIINEFLTNSYKYAFGDDGGKVKIKIKKTDNKYNLTLSDNGRGLPQDFDIKKSESFGLRIIKLLAEQLNGSFELNNTNGVVLNISFPK